MIKYQTLIITAFQDYTAEACIEYDRHLRCLQRKTRKFSGLSTKTTYLSGASLPNQPALDWEVPQKRATIFIIANQPSCHVLAQPQTLLYTWTINEPHLPYKTCTSTGAEICICFNTTRGSARGEACKFKHVCNTRGCGGEHPASRCPSKLQLEQIITPLLQQFEKELKFYTEPSWVKEVLTRVSLLDRCHRISRNLASASQHPQIIDKELGKEIRTRRRVRPFDTQPIPNLQCSGVGVISKKTGGQLENDHALSAPPDSSINDGIDKEEFTLRYATVNDMVQMINRPGSNSLPAKIDIKSACLSYPTSMSQRQRAAGHGGKSTMWIAVSPLDFDLPHLYSINMLRHWNEFFVTTISFKTPFTTWMIFWWGNLHMPSAR